MLQPAGWNFRLILAAAFLAAVAESVSGADEERRPDLDQDVLPLLKARCLKCHGPIKPKGKLNLSSARSLARGGSSGPVVVPANLDESPLWDLVSSDEMPPTPEEPLTAGEKALLRRWIEEGAKDLPDAQKSAMPPPGSDHWSFARVAPAAAPSVRAADRMRTPVDRFVERSLEKKGLALGPDADRAMLIHRLSFDLTGVPPRVEEIAEFLDDIHPDAYDRLVERLLASPRFGERWGKYWLDASGYADSNGYFDADTDRPLAYRYRDYIIRAFNDDRALDRIVREQLAGDELAGDRRACESTPAMIDLLVATHFLRNGQDGTGESDGNPDEVRVDQYAVLEGAVQVIGTSLLGLTFQCAKCHDHKFEPVSQKEYYQLQAILYPAFNVEHWVKPNDRAVIAGPRGELARWEAHDKAIDAQIASLKQTFMTGPDAKEREKTLKPLIDATNAGGDYQSRQDRMGWRCLRRPGGDTDLPAGQSGHARPQGRAGRSGLLDRRGQSVRSQAPFRRRDRAASRAGTVAHEAWFAPRCAPGACARQPHLAALFRHRSGRDLRQPGLYRLAPVASRAARVPRRFAAAPGWSAKALHRMIVTSSVYRQSSAPRPEASRADPDNRLLARVPVRRLDAEAIRDAMLAASGELDGRQRGPYIPTTRNESGEIIVDESTPARARRSIYLQQRRTQTTSLLDVFDAPSIVTTCTRRLASTIPLQSLSLLNSAFVVARAQKLAERIESECRCGSKPEPDRDALITRAFLLTAGRAPGREERDAARRFLERSPAVTRECRTRRPKARLG